MRFELSIALRHLSSRKIRSGLISIVTIITTLGVVVGVMALIAVIAVIDGAREDYIARLINQQAHIQIWTERLLDYHSILDIVSKDPEVVAASPKLKCYGLLKVDVSLSGLRDSRPAQILGVDPDLETQVAKILEPPPKFNDDGTTISLVTVVGKRWPGPGEIVLGSVLAERLHSSPYGGEPLGPGDTVYALTGRTAQTGSHIVPKTYRLVVAGVVKTGVFDIDEAVALVDMETGQDLNMLEPGRSDFIQVYIKDPYAAEMVATRLEKAIERATGLRTGVVTWGKMYPELFRALTLEKIIMFVIVLLVVLVAGLNLFGTLILVTMEKTREIGILRAIGVSRRSISRVFVYEGALIGVVGTATGIVCGLILCAFLKYAVPVLFPGIIPEAIYGLDRVPVLVKPATVAIIAASSISVCLIASVIPAWKAARLNVVEALRYE